MSLVRRPRAASQRRRVPFGFVGLVTYGVAVYPRAMRDIWT
jgi:hypothetical protein